MDAKHTPQFTQGPWVAYSEEGNTKSGEFLHSVCRSDLETKGYGDETFHDCVAETRGKTPEEARARANLVAAAPDLLQALQDIIAEWRDTDADFPALRAARAAIAKALGNE